MKLASQIIKEIWITVGSKFLISVCEEWFVSSGFSFTAGGNINWHKYFRGKLCKL